jgi:DNA-binding NarL/FixJ family response regulator
MHDPVTPLVGRASELSTIAAAAQRARQGYPGVLVLTGERGIGKTALMRHALGRLSDFAVLVGRGSPSSAPEPFGLAQTLTEALPSPAPTMNSLTAATAPILDIVGIREETGPVVVSVDDLDRADRESVDALALFVRRLRRGDRVLVLVACRQAADEGLWQRLQPGVPNFHEVRLSGLDASAVRELARSRGLQLGVREAMRLRDHTEGSPLHLRTLLREIPATAWPMLRELPAPRNYADLIATQFRRLSPVAAQVAAALSVLGRASTVPELSAMVIGVDLDAGVVAGVKAGFLTVDSWRRPPRVQVSHPMLGAAIRQQLPAVQRRRLHALAATLSVGSTAIEHRVLAAESSNEVLARDLDDLADQAHAQGEHRLAAQYLAWAEQVSATPHDRERRFLWACYEQLLANDLAPVKASIDGIRGCANVVLRGLVQGMLNLRERQTAKAIQLLRPALQQALREGPPLVAARTAAALAEAYHYCDSPDRDAVEAARRLAGTFWDPITSAHLSALELAHIGATNGIDAALEKAAESGLPDNSANLVPDTTDALVIRGLLHYKAGDLDRARADLRVSGQRVRSGTPSALAALGECSAAVTCWLTGDWDQAQSHAELAREMARDIDLPLALAVSALIPSCRGELDSAEHYLKTAAAHCRPGLAPNEALMHAVVAGAYMHATGASRWPEVFPDRTAVVDAVDHARRWQADTPLLFLALGMIVQGELGPAGAVLEGLPLRRHAPAWVHMAIGWARGLLAEAEGGIDPALHQLRQTAAQYGDVTTAPLLHAHLLQDLGRLLMAKGYEQEGLPTLRRALHTYRELGAVTFEEQAQGFQDRVSLHAAEPPVAFLSLTSRERQVASLVGRGMTNPEIGRSLFVTQRTVGYHLTNIFSKLALSSRRELRDLVQSTEAGHGGQPIIT